MAKGFTLFEILIVISVIGLLAAGAIPAIRAFQPTLRLSGITRELVNDLYYAQQTTVTEQKEYCLQLFPEDKKYQFKKCDGEIIEEKDFPVEIELVSVSGFTDNEIRYNPCGAVKEAGTITLENTKNEIRIITIKPSGFISVGEEE